MLRNRPNGFLLRPTLTERFGISAPCAMKRRSKLFPVMFMSVCTRLGESLRILVVEYYGRNLGQCVMLPIRLHKVRVGHGSRVECRTRAATLVLSL